MFTGIIESLGEVKKLEKEGGNLHITLSSNITQELKIDQSVAHNGVCLTVVKIAANQYTVTAIEETLEKTNLNDLLEGDLVNLERAMVLGSRLDGHIVQGHVDQTGECINIEEKDGSWFFTFSYDPKQNNVTIEKGSITIDGTSSVAIIPYTYEHTRFGSYTIGTRVNLEFDVIGKYVSRLLEIRG